ncbi:MAG TPA: WD40 repeat domain-containing protein, partial [Isosphaeraceae bacterium]|nr:WD40 repeat domain-containing protein [Isosphaeraceae bacterium]
MQRPIVLSPDLDGRWFSYTFVPPGPGHPRLLLAVGTRFSLHLFDVETGQKTRSLNGHTGPVYGLAPSPDGRWLASASQDQTIALWPLAGMDTRPPLGARFDRLEDGRFRIAEVTPRGHADAAGLEPGMIVEMMSISFAPDKPTFYQQPEDQKKALKLVLDQKLEGLVEPGMSVVFLVQDPKNPGPVRVAGTTRREPPALSLFVGQDRQWVLWMPEGYYDTSINGDKRFVGWHLNNQVSIFRPRRTEFTPLKIHEKTFYSPDRIRNLLLTADRNLALAPQPNAAPPVPVNTTTTPMGVVTIGNEAVSLFRIGQGEANARVVRNNPGQPIAPRIQVDAGGTSPVVEVTLKIGEQVVETRQVPAPGTSVDVTFAPVQSVGPQVLSVETRNQAGVIVPRYFQVDFGEARKRSSLHI